MPNPSNFPLHLRKLVCDLLKAGGQIARHGAKLLIAGPPEADVAVAALRARVDELATHVVPSVTPGEAAATRKLLDDAGASVAYITDPEQARRIVADICSSQPDVIGLDFETEVLPPSVSR
jgi:hypothetical protein